MGHTFLMKALWACFLLLMCLVKLSSQTSTNGIDVALQELKTFILARLDNMDQKLSKLDEMDQKLSKLDELDHKLSKLDELDNKLSKLDDMDQKLSKLEDMDQKLSKLDELDHKLSKLDYMDQKLSKLEDMDQKLSKLDELDHKLSKLDDVDQKLSKLEDMDQKLSKLDELDHKLSKLDDMDQKLSKLEDMVEEKSLLTFNPSEMTLFEGEEANLECGIIGEYRTCQWDHGGSLIYQLADVRNGFHADIKAASTSISNQCGIIIASVNTTYGGVWTCTVLTFGQTLNASKTITIEGCPDGFIMASGSKQCFKLFNDKVTWEQAKIKCEAEGLVRARPSDAVAVTLRKDLLDTYGDVGEVWVDARGGGSQFVWQRDGTVMRRNSPLVRPSYRNTNTNYCLSIWVSSSAWNSHPQQPYAAASYCRYSRATLCEVI